MWGGDIVRVMDYPIGCPGKGVGTFEEQRNNQRASARVTRRSHTGEPVRGHAGPLGTNLKFLNKSNEKKLGKGTM